MAKQRSRSFSSNAIFSENGNACSWRRIARLLSNIAFICATLKKCIPKTLLLLHSVQLRQKNALEDVPPTVQRLDVADGNLGIVGKFAELAGVRNNSGLISTRIISNSSNIHPTRIIYHRNA